MIPRDKDRYWTACHQGEIRRLFRMELPMANFHRLTIDGWEYVPERYPHVAWDSSFDEIDEEHAFEIIEALEKKKFAPCRIPHCWRCREFKINGNPAG